MAIFDIAFMGTSLTAGTGTGYNGTTRVNGGLWQPHVLQALSVGKRSELRYYNFGISGGTSLDGIATIGSVAPLRAKMAIIEFCMNDSQINNNISLAQSKTNAENIINMLRAANPTILIGLMTMNPVLSAIVNRPNLSEYYQQYRTMAASRSDIFLIDNEPAWAGATTTQIPDSIHPLLAEVRARLTPDIVSAIGPLID